jgi:hypothetical protein
MNHTAKIICARSAVNPARVHARSARPRCDATALLARDGREIPVHHVLVAHRGAGREIDYVSTIARDIAERKCTEERQELIIEANRRLAAWPPRSTTGRRCRTWPRAWCRASLTGA